MGKKTGNNPNTYTYTRTHSTKQTQDIQYAHPSVDC